MKVTSITVSSGRKIPHPAVDFANLTSFVSLTASLEGEDIPGIEAENLQIIADSLVEMHIADLQQRNAPQPRLSKPAEATANTAAKLADKHAPKFDPGSKRMQ